MDEGSRAGRKGVVRLRAKFTGERPGSLLRIRTRARLGDVVLEARGNPCEVEGRRIFWGDLHSHCGLGHGQGKLESLYEYAREEEGLDFVAHVEHYAFPDERWIGDEWRRWKPSLRSLKDYIEETWEYRKEVLRRYYEPGEFVNFLAFEWSVNVYGDMCVYYLGDDEPCFYPDAFYDPRMTPDVLWELLKGREAIAVPHHTSFPVGWEKYPGRLVGIGGYDWRFYNPEFVHLVEIYSKQGCSEYFGCPFPVPHQAPEGCVVEALKRGYRLGFVACSDTNIARPGSFLIGEKRYPRSGLTAVFAENLDRPSIYYALKGRRCYATTGERIILDFRVNGAFMGEELHLGSPEEEKEVRFTVLGTDFIERAEVVKNGRVAFRYDASQASPHIRTCELSCVFPDREGSRRGDYYYLRVVQRDGAMAWSSPVWIEGRKT